MPDNEKNPRGRPELTLIPARPPETESYLITDGLWFRKVRELAETWRELELDEED
jgi:hypothetical protein